MRADQFHFFTDVAEEQNVNVVTLQLLHQMHAAPIKT